MKNHCDQISQSHLQDSFDFTLKIPIEWLPLPDAAKTSLKSHIRTPPLAQLTQFPARRVIMLGKA